ncbi:unnamed protein product [Adineta steineri]|uniref:Uncharacterized protein n=1 Tax=Adineta steineri TaxID=433720 RepID=A0A813U5L0_9BILA|nr:unnamed protein product [Adineta steineri]
MLSGDGVRCAQPYFPPQITFSTYENKAIYAIDELNQQAYRSYIINPTLTEYSFAMQHFPFAIPDSPESKYYVQLKLSYPSNSCNYGTYWKYGDYLSSAFPSHWNFNDSSFKIDNFVNFRYDMIHSNNNTGNEDYWYANETCRIDSGEYFPCQEIYFKKNTDIPLRSAQVVRRRWERIPQNWAYNCTDLSLGLLYNPQLLVILLNNTSSVQLWLNTPPHRINGNGTVIIEWHPSTASKCNDCVTWTPKQFSFNSITFQQTQTLHITRVKDGQDVRLIPIFSGGGFDIVDPEQSQISIY